MNNGGWDWLEKCGGWWDGADGYRPYRHNDIRDDFYLPYLSYDWIGDPNGWHTSVYARNNNGQVGLHAVQHALYDPAGDDLGALHQETRLRQLMTNEIQAFDTSEIVGQPGQGYGGAGVLDASTVPPPWPAPNQGSPQEPQTGASVVVNAINHETGESMMYTGIAPFSALLQATGETLYLPAFPYDFTTPEGHYNARVLVQNAGSDLTDISAVFYEPDGTGTPCGTAPNVAPWGRVIFNAADCGFTQPTLGALRLDASQPLAAIGDLQFAEGPRRTAYNAFSAGTRDLFAPLLVRDYFGWTSGIHFHDVSGVGNRIFVTYYNSDGSWACSDPQYPLRSDKDHAPAHPARRPAGRLRPVRL